MNIRELYFAHELDAAWIIALWKAIHGGDGGPEEVAAQAIAALAQYVSRPSEVAFSFNELKTQFGKLGIQVTERAEEAAQAAAPQVAMAEDIEHPYRPRQYCFKFKGETICTDLPNLTHLRTAA
jgi:hypothetical protein